MWRRALDILLAAAGAVLLACILPSVALAIKLQSSGPVFFVQERVGRGGSIFRLVKLRTMNVRPDQGEARWADQEEDRVFPVGRWLRASHLDELPQVLNVLAGSMSIIGPRPEQVPIVERLKKEIPNYDVRHSVRPGITGWAQVRYRYGCSELDGWIKLGYELYYIENANPLLDLRLLASTVPVVLTGRGAR